ncbi:hypothetical protein BVRB_2g031410 [Beta vulgaris subsp. vulgaris]|nr:hypothetical protein BVRB_2g031410 [Beta vulgaris subsp. vulgaris]
MDVLERLVSSFVDELSCILCCSFLVNAKIVACFLRLLLNDCMQIVVTLIHFGKANFEFEGRQ